MLKKNIILKKGRIKFNKINAYITNLHSAIIISNQVKKVKLEWVICFLYGRLISFLLSYTIVFTYKSFILEEDKKQFSELSFRKLNSILT